MDAMKEKVQSAEKNARRTFPTIVFLPDIR